MGDGVPDRAAGLMAMLTVRSEGFYGRDMARFFSAVQVRETVASWISQTNESAINILWKKAHVTRHKHVPR